MILITLLIMRQDRTWPIPALRLTMESIPPKSVNPALLAALSATSIWILKCPTPTPGPIIHGILTAPEMVCAPLPSSASPAPPPPSSWRKAGALPEADAGNTLSTTPPPAASTLLTATAKPASTYQASLHAPSATTPAKPAIVPQPPTARSATQEPNSAEDCVWLTVPIPTYRNGTVRCRRTQPPKYGHHTDPTLWELHIPQLILFATVGAMFLDTMDTLPIPTQRASIPITSAQPPCPSSH